MYHIIFFIFYLIGSAVEAQIASQNNLKSNPIQEGVVGDNSGNVINQQTQLSQPRVTTVQNPTLVTSRPQYYIPEDGTQYGPQGYVQQSQPSIVSQSSLRSNPVQIGVGSNSGNVINNQAPQLSQPQVTTIQNPTVVTSQPTVVPVSGGQVVPEEVQEEPSVVQGPPVVVAPASSTLAPVQGQAVSPTGAVTSASGNVGNPNGNNNFGYV